ncbi:MAG: hypothetical protein JNL06_06675 [Alphaproteobacteria bacterium]|nr:hypothetical protein [Alphaproteobacteria bacterium]
MRDGAGGWIWGAVVGATGAVGPTGAAAPAAVPADEAVAPTPPASPKCGAKKVPT